MKNKKSSSEPDVLIRKMDQVESLKKAVNQSHFNKVVLLTPKEVCQILHISTRTLQTWRDLNVLAYIQIHRKIFFRVEDIIACMDAHYIPLNVKKGGAA